MLDDNLAQSQKDFLTGFYTRERLSETLSKRIVEANLRNKKLSILLIDIDHFKKINDKHGHHWGDEFLKYVSSTLRLTLQEKGIIFRYGGDEFIVLFNDPDPKQAFAQAKLFNVVMRNRPFLFNANLFKITLSCGLATYPDDAKDAEELIKIADKAMYFSKKSGRNMTIQASKLGFHKLKLIVLLLVKIFIVLAIVLTVGGYFFKDKAKAYIPALNKFSFKRVLPVRIKYDTKIILKTGDVILGKKIAETSSSLILEMSLGEGTGKVTIEKRRILSIENIKR